MGTAASVNGAAVNELPKDMTEKAEQLFLLLDQDEDGVLRKIEVKHYYKKILAMKDQKAYRAEVDRMMNIFSSYENKETHVTEVSMSQFTQSLTTLHNADADAADSAVDAALAAFKRYHKKRAKAKNEKRRARRLKRLRANVKVGSEVEVKQSGVWRPATVKAINDDDTYEVEVDGAVSQIPMSRCRINKKKRRPHRQSHFQRGTASHSHRRQLQCRIHRHK